MHFVMPVVQIVMKNPVSWSELQLFEHWQIVHDVETIEDVEAHILGFNEHQSH